MDFIPKQSNWVVGLVQRLFDGYVKAKQLFLCGVCQTKVNSLWFRLSGFSLQVEVELLIGIDKTRWICKLTIQDEKLRV